MEFWIIILVGVIVSLVLSGVYMLKKSRAEKERQKNENAQRMAIYRKFADEFEHLGWTSWGYGAHTLPGQRERIQRAIYSNQMQLVRYDANEKKALVLGEHGVTYEVSPEGCSCIDFRSRALPCKHMYFAVMSIDTDI